jgi:hypothetical protein
MQETAWRFAARRSLGLRNLPRGCLDVSIEELFAAKQVVAKSPWMRDHLKGAV